MAIADKSRPLFRKRALSLKRSNSGLRKLALIPFEGFWKSIPSYLAFYVLAVVVGYAAFQGFRRATIIAAFQLPPENKEKPLPFSGSTVADVLRNAIIAITAEAEGRVVPSPCDASASKDTFFGGLTARAGTSFEVGDPVRVEVNGVSSAAVISEARRVLGRERTISGDVVLKDVNSFVLMASANDVGPWTVSPQQTSLVGLENAGCELAERILADTDKNLLAAALIRRQEYVQVIHLYSPPELFKEDPDALNNLGVALTKVGTTQTNQNAAIDEFRKAIALTRKFGHFGIGNFPEAHYNLATVLRNQQRPEEALAEYRLALIANPKYSEAHYGLGYLLDHYKVDAVGAVREYRKALEFKPDFPEAHSNLGRILLFQGHIEEAIKEYREALTLRPNHALAHIGLGSALDQQGNLDEAVKEYRKAIAIDPDLPDAHSNLGTIFVRQGHLEEAIEEYRKALAEKPGFPEARDGLENALRMQKAATQSLSNQSHSNR